MWVRYFDMCSGGDKKTEYGTIFIEADDFDDADERFCDLFDRDPYHITCTCCGPDYTSCEVPDNTPGLYDEDGVISYPK